MKGIWYMISYNPLWRTLVDKDMKKTSLVKLFAVNYGTVSKPINNDSYSLSIRIKQLILHTINILILIQYN